MEGLHRWVHVMLMSMPAAWVSCAASRKMKSLQASTLASMCLRKSGETTMQVAAMSAAATAIQARWRCTVQLRRWRALRHAALVAQACARRGSARRRFLAVRGAALALQARVLAP